MNEDTAKTKRYHLERPFKIKEEITIEETEIEPYTENPENLNSHSQWTNEEQASSTRKVQSKTRANVRKRSNQGFNGGNGIRNRFYLAAIADPKYQKPFLYGWRREVVYSRRDSDRITIVYSKEAKKFRTYDAIRSYLKETGDENLTMDNFLLYKIPLGLDTSREIIRVSRASKEEKECSKWTNPSVNHESHLPKIRSLREIYKEKIIDKHKKVEDVSSNETTKEKVNETDVKRSFQAASDPRLYEPFVHGWKREVIYKNRKTDMAIYYIAPNNKIIHSMEGISAYLKTFPNNHLTTSNFTFYCGPLGVNDPTKEIIRRLTATELPDRDYTTYGSPLSKRRNIENIKDPRFLKPFAYGWKRELVYRATRQQHKFIDVYYHTKDGDKLRSKIEVCEYLKKIQCKTLTVDNFTFLQDAIGPPDPTMEIIRNAVKLTGRDHKTYRPLHFKRRKIENKSRPPIFKRRKIENIKDPRFLKPFSYGWKRELVFRATRQQHKFIDVYYHTKDGDKLRSKVEIFEYLKKIQCKTLTVDNFTFLQDAIRPLDSTKEIIRNAIIQNKNK